jgi:peptidoglycan/LPS O-acetylase OafA/YrhL
MYYVGICFYLLQYKVGVSLTTEDATHVTALNLFSNITFLHGLNPYWAKVIVPGGWTIGVEMIFYFILPYLFSKINTINRAVDFFILTVICKFLFDLILLNFTNIGLEKLSSEYMFYYFPNQLPVFALGIILYFCIYETQKIDKISGKSLLVISGILLTQLASGIQILPNHILFGIAFLFLGIGLSRFKFKLFVNPFVRYIGMISYSMYLVHFAVLYWMTKFNIINYASNGILNYLIRFLVVFLLTTLISSIFYRVIEVKFQALGKKIIDKLEKKHREKNFSV